VSESPPPSGEPSRAEPGGRRAGRPAPPGSAEGRAHAFRESEARRREEVREQIGVVLVVVIIVLGVYTLLGAKPYTSSATIAPPPSGPTIHVTLGTPAVGSVACSGGGTAYTERIPWNGSTQPLTTGDINLRVYEIWDRDYITDPHAVANATTSNVCAGTPPNPIALWYVVMAAPNGTNILTYTQANDWTSLTPAPANQWIENGSALVLVTQMPLDNTGRGFQVYGYSAGSVVFGTLPL